jgi:UDP-glucose 4-epimerase
VRILVTGGAGFIGSNAVSELLERGHEVTVYDNLSIGRRENVPDGAELVVGDVLDTQRLGRVIGDRRVDKVCHLAARVSIRASTDGFYADAEQNIMGTLSVVQAVLQSEAQGVVFASSMAVYADSAKPQPIPETYRTEPISPYGISKLAGEKFVHNIVGGAGRQSTVVRLFNTYGPGQTYTPYVGVMTIFATKLLRGESPIIFGSGRQVRDFVYVKDIARGLRLALESAVPGNTYNLGSGQPRSVNAVGELLQQAIRPDVPLLWGPEQAGEITNSIADISRAGAELGYAPMGVLEEKVEEIVEGIRKRNITTQRAS